MRRTKIVATLGPGTSEEPVLKELFKAGTDIVRLNFSHGSPEEHIRVAELVRKCAKEVGRAVGILVDLQGPKIRIQKFVDGSVDLKEGASFVLDVDLDKSAGNLSQVGVAYKDLIKDVSVGNRLLLDDGRIVLLVESMSGSRINTKVEIGGVLSNNKGINLQGGGLSAPALTAKDRADIKTAAEIDANYVAVSFPRSADDIKEAQILINAAGGHADVVAKIERVEALDNIDEIIRTSAAIMIARGDLGVEVGDAALPAIQKSLIKQARDMNKIVITATQMMESMIHNAIPTRAEVFDVANAVLDGTDAVMLSAETAVGEHPVKVVESMGRVCEAAETHKRAMVSSHRLNSHFESVDETIAMSTMYAANHLGVTAIVALTESGSTPLAMSRISSGIPIYALTRHERIMGRVALYRGVYPMHLPEIQTDHAAANKMAVSLLEKAGVVKNGDLVIITKGDLMGVHGGTNAMKIVKVGELVEPKSN